ncbi:MAG: hypothetical protein R2762_13275 [Bryobacteraceae bacterium]
MSAWTADEILQGRLYGRDGRLVTVRVSVEASLLEDLLEALAELDFPINPQIHHLAREQQTREHQLGLDVGLQGARPVGACAVSVVEFPAYERWLPLLRARLGQGGLPHNLVEVTDFVLDASSGDVPSDFQKKTVGTL